MSWQEKQGAILTGNNVLAAYSALYKDFLASDLPHYLLRNKSSRKTFQTWLKCNRRSNQLLGCWSRPIIAGGFQESTDQDTAAFNLQSPSFFIDMRYANGRSNSFAGKRDFADFTLEELFQLSQQHCFGGYSLPELPENSNNNKNSSSPSPVFTRHHIIDWNYHPAFPRNRPNRWFVQYYKNPTDPGRDSFKEFSWIRDNDGVPVYFERWERIPSFVNQQTKYLVLRKSLPCPLSLAKRANPVPLPRERRDGLLIVTGSHFAFILDRDYSLLLEQMKGSGGGEDLRSQCKGGGGMFIQYLLKTDSLKTEEEKRALIEEYLGLEGIYGQLVVNDSEYEEDYEEHNNNNSKKKMTWKIIQSTFPWNEGKELFQEENDSLMPVFEKDRFLRLEWESSVKDVTATTRRSAFSQGCWEVMECSFEMNEIYELFGKVTHGGSSTRTTRSKL
jgi:hypothetical protein